MNKKIKQQLENNLPGFKIVIDKEDKSFEKSGQINYEGRIINKKTGEETPTIFIQKNLGC